MRLVAWAVALAAGFGQSAKDQAVQAIRGTLHTGQVVAGIVPLGGPGAWAYVAARHDASMTNPNRMGSAELGLLLTGPPAKMLPAIPLVSYGQDSTGLRLAAERAGDAWDVVATRTYGPTSGGSPATLEAFKASETMLEPMGKALSNDEFVKRVIRGHTVYQGCYEIARDLPHYAEPRWPVLYEVVGDKLAQVSANYPEVYEPWVGRLMDMLKLYPLDKDLWAYYGLSVKFSHGNVKARDAQLEVLAFCERVLKAAKDKGSTSLSQPIDALSKAKVKGVIAQLEHRIKANQGYPTPAVPDYWLIDVSKSQK